MASNPTPSPEAEASTIPLTGKFVKAVLDNFSLKSKGSDWEICSIGVAKDSVVATDNVSAIIVGRNVGGHVATYRPAAILEAERAKIYGDSVRLDDIARSLDDEKELRPMPDVQRAINRELGGMKALATVNPVALWAVAKVAIAAGALTVDLYQPEGEETNSLGFRMVFPPESRNLFNAEWEDPIEVRGVFKTLGSFTAEKAEDDDQPGASTPPTTGEASPQKAEPVAAAAVTPPPAPEPEPEPEPIDVNAEIEREGYRLPPLSLLEVRLSERSKSGGHEAEIHRILMDNNISSRVRAAGCGPRLTQYEVEVPATVKVSRLAGLADDFQMHLGVESVRVEAPIPGKKAVGIEVPNPNPRTVGLLDLCADRKFVDAESRLTVALGEDIGGRPVYMDLTQMPHLLVGGATNAGKSIGLAGILTSLLMRNTPKDLRMVMIDPKRVELTLFDRIPHLMCPVIKDVKEAAGVLRALWREMDRRYELFSEAGVRNIDGWNAKAGSFQERMPYIVVVIDEMADLMLQCGGEVETVVTRLGSMARAVGIHMIIATQRPSVDIVTGLIKANVPSRIGFAVASMTDSRVILDEGGAEKLLGKGDMLFKPINAMKTRRVQSAFVSEEEVSRICNHWRNLAQPQYTIQPVGDEGEVQVKTTEVDGDDPLWADAVRWAVDRRQCSTSMLQRKFSIGFQRASRLLDEMEKAEIVGPRDGPQPREVLVSIERAEEILEGVRDE